MFITPQQKCNNISDFSLTAFLSSFCEQDVQSFTVARWTDLLPYIVNSRNGQGNFCLKGLSHEIDFKNFDENLQNLAYLRDAAGF
jgi:hypothetical protein